MFKLYVAIHGGWGMRKVAEIERAIERGFGLHTDDIKTLHSCTYSFSCLPVVSQPKCALLKTMNLLELNERVYEKGRSRYNPL